MPKKDVKKVNVEPSNEALIKSIDELKGEVKELRELVTILVEVIMNRDQDDGPEFDSDLMPMDKFSSINNFSM